MIFQGQDLSEERFIVTGGTGFIGSRLIRKLISEGVKPPHIRVIYYPGSLTTAVEDLPVELYPLNILDKPSLAKAFHGFKYIFHLIGNTAMDNKSKRIQWLVNVEGTRNLLENAQEFERIVYTSTVNTLGCPYPIGSLGNEETSPYASVRPELGKEVPKLHTFDSPEQALEFADAVNQGNLKKWWKKIGIGYFDSKLAAQELVNRAHKDKKLPIISVLPGTTFGPGDDLIGPGLLLLRVQSNSMPGFIKKGGLPLVHVADQANGHYLAMRKGKPGQRYIITGFEDDNRYLNDLLKIIAEIVQEKEPERKIKVPSFGIGYHTAWLFGLLMDFLSFFKKKPMPLGRDAVRAGGYPSFYTYTKARQELGYLPTKTFGQAIEDMYEYYKKKEYFGIKNRIGTSEEIKKDHPKVNLSSAEIIREGRDSR